jgi:hypothetical protein
MVVVVVVVIAVFVGVSMRELAYSVSEPLHTIEHFWQSGWIGQ